MLYLKSKIICFKGGLILKLAVNRTKIAEMLGIHEQTVKRKGYPIVEGAKRDNAYDVVACLKFHYGDDWEYYFRKLIEE